MIIMAKRLKSIMFPAGGGMTGSRELHRNVRLFLWPGSSTGSSIPTNVGKVSGFPAGGQGTYRRVIEDL
jgi:hypothetical protein